MAASETPILPSASDKLSLADQAFFRAAGAPLIVGNSIRLLRDAQENYPAWKKSISEARRTVQFENFIIHDDAIGREFADLLARKAREGVHVRVLYDWMGSIYAGSWWSLWRRLRRAGVEVRCFNPPRIDSAFGWLSRDHRKTVVVDSRIAFVTGLCVGRHWVGNPDRGVAPWRDTGVSIEGPAVAEVERAFASTWATCGTPLPESDLANRSAPAGKGNFALRIVATQPGLASMYRLDHSIAAVARESIWLTDAYFLGTSSYVQAICAAAADGVDVRLLLPRASDVPFVRAISRSGYRTLLDAGVRIFEWNGPMLHAKTAVADGRWARVGSTNLNVTSWISNWELDVIVEDEGFASEMQAMYLDDLSNSTEIVLSGKRRPSPVVARRRRVRPRGATRGSANWAAKGVLRFGKAVGASVTANRVLGPAEASLMVSGALVLLGIVAAAVLLPKLITGVVAVVAGWMALTLLVQAWRLHFPRKRSKGKETDRSSGPRRVS